jgi:hypothetical protein
MLRFTRKTRTLGARRPLPLALAAIFGTTLLAAQVTVGYTAEPDVARQPASVVPVTTCNDDLSAGSLREVLLHAVSGDTVDMTSLQCSSISLGYGALFVSVDDLTIAGNGQTIFGSRYQNVLDHVGHGLLSMTAINLNYARYDGVGGCLYSAGSLYFARGSVSDCTASDRGGAIYVKGDLTLLDSVISGNSVSQHNLPPPTVGGGVFVGGDATVTRSEVSGNTATSPTNQSYGGGFFTAGELFVGYSTFSGNAADEGGALYGQGSSSLTDSTLSGNSALNAAAAAINGDTLLQSDTIAFNTVTCSPGCPHPYAFGVIAGILNIENTIAANTDGGDDLRADGLVISSNNLIVHGTVPPGTLQSDPRLQPLAINGSRLLVQPLTHALGPGSPAIDAGAATAFVTLDERGLPRSSGAAPDIGAYEVQSGSDDVIFTDGFD